MSQAGTSEKPKMSKLLDKIVKLERAAAEFETVLKNERIRYNNLTNAHNKVLQINQELKAQISEREGRGPIDSLREFFKRILRKQSE